MKQKIDSTLEQFDSELTQLEQNFIADINTKTDEFKTSEKGKITEKSTNFDQTVQENQDKILATLQTHKSDLDTKTNQFTSSVQGFSLSYLDEVYSRLNTLLDNLRDDLNNLSAQFDNDGKEWTDKSLETQMAVFNDFSSVLNDNFGKFSKLLADQDNLLGKMTIESELSNDQEFFC